MKVFDATTDNKLDIIDKIQQLPFDPEPILIRNGLEILDENGWASLLEKDCGFSNDTRQFTTRSNYFTTRWWQIYYRPERSNAYAHSTTYQPLHCDNAWFQDPADINFFIMKKQAKEGGRQILYTLDKILNDLESENPSLLKDLSSTPVSIKKGDTEYVNNNTIIDLKGNFPRIYWNFYRTNKENKNVENMCNAFFEFLDNKIKSNSTSIEYLDSKTGDCFCIYDTRTLHGREAFVANSSEDRLLLQSMWKVPSN